MLIKDSVKLNQKCAFKKVWRTMVKDSRQYFDQYVTKIYFFRSQTFRKPYSGNKKSVSVLTFLSNLFTVLTGSLSFSLKCDNIYQTYLLNYVPCKRKELFLPCFFPFKKVLRKDSSIINAPLVITVVVQI